MITSSNESVWMFLLLLSRTCCWTSSWVASDLRVDEAHVASLMLNTGNFIKSGIIYCKLFRLRWESSGVSFVASQEKPLNKQWNGWLFETPWHSCGFTVTTMLYIGTLMRSVMIYYKWFSLQWESLEISFAVCQDMVLSQPASCQWFVTPWCPCGVTIKTYSNIQGPVLLTLLRHVARILANGRAAFFESCD